MKLLRAFALYVSVLVPIYSAELRTETLSAWNKYIGSEQQAVRNRAANSAEYLWADDDPGRLRRLKAGEVVVAPVGASNPIRIPNGLIHHWIGAIFIPRASIKEVLTVLRDYDDYKSIYQPGVASAKLLQGAADRDQFMLCMVNPSLLSHSALEGLYTSDFVRLDDERLYMVSQTLRMTEIKSFGANREERLPPNSGSGYIWRLYSTTRFQRLDGGVVLEVEAIALSRCVPAGLQWMVAPIIRRTSRETLEKSLRNTSNAVEAVHNRGQSNEQTAHLR